MEHWNCASCGSKLGLATSFFIICLADGHERSSLRRDGAYASACGYFLRDALGTRRRRRCDDVVLVGVFLPRGRSRGLRLTNY